MSRCNHPGPGTYEFLAGISPKGNQFYSKYSSSGAKNWDPPNSKRFKEQKVDFGLTPGPGQYNPGMNIDCVGAYFVSNYKNSGCRTFGISKRGMSGTRNELSTPGPGSYRLPSEFGHYEANEKMKLESLRTERNRHGSVDATQTNTSWSKKILHSTSQPEIQTITSPKSRAGRRPNDSGIRIRPIYNKRGIRNKGIGKKATTVPDRDKSLEKIDKGYKDDITQEEI